MKSVLTTAQLRVYNFVLERLRLEHAPPTRKEIREHFGWKSDNSAEEHLRALARKGFLEVLPGLWRGIRVCDVHAPLQQEVVPTLPVETPAPLTSAPADSRVLAFPETPLDRS